MAALTTNVTVDADNAWHEIADPAGDCLIQLVGQSPSMGTVMIASAAAGSDFGADDMGHPLGIKNNSIQMSFGDKVFAKILGGAQDGVSAKLIVTQAAV